MRIESAVERPLPPSSASCDKVHERRLTKWIGHWATKVPTAGVGRQREYAAFGCRRSAGTLSRSMLVTCERLLSPTLICSRALAKVRFQGRPVARRENRRRLLWVDGGSSGVSTERPLHNVLLPWGAST